MRKLKVFSVAASVLGASAIPSSTALAANCKSIFSQSTRFAKFRSEVEVFKFEMAGLRVGSVSDSSLSTGATLFYFPGGKATASFDARGGSVSSVETHLLAEGSYSNSIDGILFAGGSTMGLEAHQGVRRRIFKERAQEASDFDFIPSIPGAVVYDYGGRPEKTQKPLVFPNMILGASTFDHAVENQMLIGRAGAGTSTTANKISEPIWGGQGASFSNVKLNDGFEFKIFTAVVLNAHGDIRLPPDVKVDAETLQGLRAQANSLRGQGKNTTLSLVITDVSLDRNQLKRLATMVHTSMGSMIHPFHSYTDGDILFSVSLHQRSLPKRVNREIFEETLQMKASELMSEAILKTVAVSNKAK